MTTDYVNFLLIFSPSVVIVLCYLLNYVLYDYFFSYAENRVVVGLWFVLLVAVAQQ